MAAMPTDKVGEPSTSHGDSGGGEPEYYAPGALEPPKDKAPPPLPPGPPEPEKKKLFVSGMPPTIAEDSLVKHFSYFGTVTHCFVVRNR